MGYVFATGTCYSCHNIMTFNPMKVPSIRIDGVRQPICRSCIEIANPLRVANGLPEIQILPDAYEPCDENELGD